MKVNQQYSEQAGLYERDIPERRIIATEYFGALLDIKKIETTSAVLYEYAQGKQLALVFPAGLILRYDNSRIRTKIFFEIMAKDKADSSIEVIRGGDFLCRQVDLNMDVNLTDAIRAIYEDVDDTTIVVSNMLLNKYQIGTKKS